MCFVYKCMPKFFKSAIKQEKVLYEFVTVKPLKTDTRRDEQKFLSYKGFRLIEVIFNRKLPLGHR